MNRPIRFVFLALAVVAAAVPAQTVYKSVGPDGRIVYSDRQPVGTRLDKTLKFENLPSSALPASSASYVEQLRRMQAANAAEAAQPAVAAPGGVVLYSASWCGYCRKAKAYLAAKGIGYQDIDVESRDGAVAFARAAGGGGIPVLMANGHSVRGFSEPGYDAVFRPAH